MNRAIKGGLVMVLNAVFCATPIVASTTLDTTIQNFSPKKSNFIQNEFNSTNLAPKIANYVRENPEFEELDRYFRYTDGERSVFVAPNSITYTHNDLRNTKTGEKYSQMILDIGIDGKLDLLMHSNDKIEQDDEIKILGELTNPNVVSEMVEQITRGDENPLFSNKVFMFQLGGELLYLDFNKKIAVKTILESKYGQILEKEEKFYQRLFKL